ncbi:hypothetical protein [Desulfofustis glycolicus]|uniref:Lipoprotein n=1 Tax=Desulfofustis glycolicus DSM 9705 TaxID=1121409 RepID=A0A1M5VIH9_9BACT|nr:hypothetical protein [Desulfofustis glycolicus]MCB2217614.1 hypothetical protein [Desulfobulbaceae bacterium]SHH75059.1 hypothetical protein SAMN02745124_01722 [Desulfofustis glycolicus DSM 9705]
MKTVLSIALAITLSVLLTSCDSDSDGSSGGRGDFPNVSYAKVSSGAEGFLVECYNANGNVYTGGKQVCTWNCAYHDSRTPRFVQLTFDEALVCEQTGVDATTGLATETCTREMALVDRKYSPCVLK